MSATSRSGNKKVSPKPIRGTKQPWYQQPHFVLAGISVVIFLVARLQLLSIPLERDEGGFAYIAHWMWNGKDLYTDLPDSKWPGLYTVYALFIRIFGYHATGIHTGLLIANVISAWFFFRFLRRLFNIQIASYAAGFFLILITGPNVAGFAAHATQLMLPFVLSGLFYFWRGVEENKRWLFFTSGILIGIAFTIKQQSALYGLMMAAAWWPVRLRWVKNKANKWPLSEWWLLVAGGLFPLIIVAGYFFVRDRFEAFLFWTYDQPMSLAGSFIRPWYELFADGFIQVTSGYEILWAAGAIGVVLLFFNDFSKESKWISLLFVLTSLLSIVIGVAYYRHYFVPVMPGLALGIAVLIYSVGQKLKYGKQISILIAAILFVIPLLTTGGYYLKPDYHKIHEEAYNKNMFPEMEVLGKGLAKRVPEGQKIAVLGSEPEILVAANRVSCSKHIMMYSMFLPGEAAQKMQDEYFRDITGCNAEYVVFDIFSSSWVPGFETHPLHEKLLTWLNANYVMDGIAEYREGQPGLVLWGDEARQYREQSPYVIYVMKKQ